MTRLIRKRDSLAVSRWPISAIALFGTLAIAPAYGAERVDGQVPGAGLLIAVE